jgi:hydroxypyruvate isomerase
MFQEAGERLEDRIAAAAAAGYRKVEMFYTTGRDLLAAGIGRARPWRGDHQRAGRPAHA